MANRTGRGQDLPKLQRGSVRATDIPNVRLSMTSGTNTDQGEAIMRLSNTFSAIGSRLDDRVDAIARQESLDEGLRAGRNDDVSLRQDGTIRGEAFDRGAVRSMASRHQVEARTALEGFYDQYKHDPVKLEKQFEAYRKGRMQSDLPEMVKEQFNYDYDRISRAYISDAKDRAETINRQEFQVNALQEFEARQNTIQNMALRSGYDEASNIDLAAEIDQYQAAAIKLGPKEAFTLNGVEYPADEGRAGVLDLVGIQSSINSVTDMAKQNKVLGQFYKKEGYQEKQAFFDKFQQNFQDGNSEFDFDQVNFLSREMQGQLSKDAALLKGQVKRVSTSIDQFKKQLKEGFDPGEDALKSIEAEAQLTNEPDIQMLAAAGRELYNFQKSYRLASPVDLENFINEERSRFNAEKRAPNALEAERLEIAEGMLSSMSKALKVDPLSWGNRVGLVSLNDLGLGSDQYDFQERLNQAYAVSEHYGTPLQVLTEEENTVLVSEFEKGDLDRKQQILTNFALGFGEDAPSALSDIADKSPYMGHLLGLISTDKSLYPSVRDALSGEIILKEGIKSLPAESNYRGYINEEYGTAFAFSPSTYSGAVDVAEKIYTARASRRGLNNPDNFDDDIYKRALQEAAGAIFDRDGNQYGGIGEWNGRQLVVPVEYSIDQFEDTISSLTDDDLTRLSVGGAKPAYGDGEILKAEDLDDYYLISVGDGRYLVSTTDPYEEGPSFLAGSGRNGLYEIDLFQTSGVDDE